MNHRRAALYLQIPAAYCRSFGGLRWAQYGEAVEFLDGPDAGRTFAFAPEIARFLEGVLSGEGPYLAFGLVLHLLYLIGLGSRAKASGEDAVSRAVRIAQPFRALGNQAVGSRLRNAGALCGRLCREIPGVAEPPELAEILALLNSGSWVPQMVLTHPMLGATDYAEQPGLEAGEFEARFLRALESLSGEEIDHWLKHGRGPVSPLGERVAPLPPMGLAGLLDAVEERPRLAGMTRLAGRLEGALCLPPRRLAPAQLQAGGYSDVTTRGTPEQILPFQFALDDQEFLRRFAEHELLYFHRELPCRPAAEELVLVLDQGVRTWGDVRLVLAAAAVALARQAHRRRMMVKLATTAQGGAAVDPAELEPQDLADLLEASDLSPHPGKALEVVLETPAAARRDVLLLTHPRNLDEPAVIAAARRPAADGEVRLFAVLVDSSGQVELAELRRGLPVVLSRSRVPFQDEAPAASVAPPATRRMPWRGDVQPIPFPFVCGTLDRLLSNAQRSSLEWDSIAWWSHPPREDLSHVPAVLHDDADRPFDFDDGGDRILVIGRHGLLCSWQIDGNDAEVLPRPLVDDRLMMPVRGVIGVAGGFVINGYRRDRQVLAHYDFDSRTCTLHTVEDEASSIAFVYYRDLHTIVGRVGGKVRRSLAFDLAVAGAAATVTPRAGLAAERHQKWGWAGSSFIPESYPFPFDSPNDPHATVLRLDSRSGTVHYRRAWSKVTSLTPLSDGRPALAGGQIVRAREGGDVLAVQVEGGYAPGLYFLSRSRATVLGKFLLGADRVPRVFALSRDGRRFARLIGDRRLEVRDVPGDVPPVLVTAEEDVGVHFGSLGRSCLLVREFEVGGPRRPRSSCLIRWDQGRLEFVARDARGSLEPLAEVVAESRSLPPGHPAHRPDPDPLRWVQFLEHGGLQILIDRYNHLAVLGRGGGLLCMFYVNRDEAAAWMPDGTCLGSRRLIGGEATPGAAERIASVLRAAEQREGGSA